jgi:hypothetical protein
MALNDPDVDGNVQVVGCSTKTYTPEKLEELPSDPDRPQGHPRTRLRKPTFAVGDWIEDVSASTVCAVKGFVPSSVYDRVWDKVLQFRPDLTKPV